MTDIGHEGFEILDSWAADHGIALSSNQVELLRVYLDELWVWNQKMNLTGLSSKERIITELLLDSLIPTSFLPEEGTLLDVGSGAGFPGIPMKISNPRLKVHLLESSSRKVSFLRQIIRLTGLSQIEVIRGRIDRDNALLCTQGYQIVTSRAVAELWKTLQWCAPCLIPGGMLVSFLGKTASKALDNGANVIRTQRLSLWKSVTYRLPGKNFQRQLAIFRKDSST